MTDDFKKASILTDVPTFTTDGTVMTPKDATDAVLQIEADKQYYACLPHAADSGVRLAILKRGMAIERARLRDILNKRREFLADDDIDLGAAALADGILFGLLNELDEAEDK